jgi:hypothetical protein
VEECVYGNRAYAFDDDAAEGVTYEYYWALRSVFELWHIINQ